MSPGQRITGWLVSVAVALALAGLVWGVWTLTSPSRPGPGHGDDWGSREASRRAGVSGEADVIARPGSPDFAAREYAQELDGFELRQRFEQGR